jgi:drug/metabolite transporter (DMT)-like permease
VAGYGSQVTMTMALRRVKAAPATAMSYLSVVWGILAGLAIFSVSRPNCHCHMSGPLAEYQPESQQ